MEIVHTVPPTGDGAQFTCNTCGLSFPTADLQRLHMKTDWHRYNLKRKVASLPPVTSEAFAEKMLQQQQAQATSSAHIGRGSNGRSSGLRQVTKRDKKREEKLLRKMQKSKLDSENPTDRPGSPTGSEVSMGSSTFSLGEPIEDQDGFEHLDIPQPVAEGDEDAEEAEHATAPTANNTKGSETTAVPNADEVSGIVGGTDEAAGNDENEEEIKRRLAQAVKIPPTVCFVDGKEFDTVDDNVEYLSHKYGMFIPERDYLTDLSGLITYLGEKIGLGNMCLYCSFQGRSLEAIRAHLIAKQHVKIPYDSLEDKLELSPFYDFSSSYKRKVTKARAVPAVEAGDDDEWEDVSGDEGAGDDDEDDDELDDEADGDGLYVDESGYELALTPGLRAGHRSLARYYRQSFRPTTTQDGQGTVVAADSRTLVAARDPVQQKQQKQAWKESRRQRNVAYRRDKNINNQMHYRDELLQ